MTAPHAPGALRRLQRLTTSTGRFHVIALDHRDSLRSAAADEGLSLDDEDLRQFKRDVLGVATPHVSGVMLDPELSWPSFAAERAVAPEVGVICALEAQGYESDPDVGNTWLPGWDPTLLARSGADAAKLLVLYRPDGSKLAASQERLVRTTVDACAELELPLFVEPVPVGVPPERRGDAIVRTVERLASMGPMVLKLPYPGDEACAQVEDACAGTAWALLSWGVDFDAFEHQLGRAVAAGCAGFMVGRAVWRDALDPRDRDETLPLVAERLGRLAALTG